MFKTETHMHVSEVSPCSKLSAAEMVKIYHEAGYKTLFVADHFQKERYFDTLGDISWAEKIDCFLKGYKNAKKAAEKFSMNVILSAEISFGWSCNHYLVYGIDEEFLKNCPDIFDMGIEKFYPYAKERGVTVIQAHPYRDMGSFPTPEFVDGFEVYNSNPRHDNYTEKAIETAQKYNKPMTAGSDSHRTEDTALTGVETEEEIRTAENYINAVMNGKIKIIREEVKG